MSCYLIFTSEVEAGYSLLSRAEKGSGGAGAGERLTSKSSIYRSIASDASFGSEDVGVGDANWAKMGFTQLNSAGTAYSVNINPSFCASMSS